MDRALQIQEHMIYCHHCDFSYLPFDSYFETHCPECDSKIMDEDELYLMEVEDYEDSLLFDEIDGDWTYT